VVVGRGYSQMLDHQQEAETLPKTQVTWSQYGSPTQPPHALDANEAWLRYGLPRRHQIVVQFISRIPYDVPAAAK
jgi:hypothetical protein